MRAFRFKVTMPRGRRRAAAAVELAVLLPVLCFIGMATVDYGRANYAAVTIANCAFDGAMYKSDPRFAASTGYADYQHAALADASNLSPAPTVTSTSGTDAGGNSYVTVAVAYTFNTLVNYPGIPNTVPLTRSATMVVTPP
jgi:Flp pilus assembly protein TadG